MAKICPVTNKAVIYLSCAECEQKVECRAGNLTAQKVRIKDASRTEAKKIVQEIEDIPLEDIKLTTTKRVTV